MKQLALFCLALAGAILSAAQTGIGTTTPHASAALDVSSTNQGLLPPRMTWAQIQAIPAPAAGLMVYDVGAKSIRLFNGSSWILLAPMVTTLSSPSGAFSGTGKKGGDGDWVVVDCAMGADKSVYLCGDWAGGNIMTVGGITVAPPSLDAIVFWEVRFDGRAGLDKNSKWGRSDWQHIGHHGRSFRQCLHLRRIC